jgi:hypothetical protein
MFREAISYPGFAFLHVLAGCVTYQKPSYAAEIYRRCDLAPADYDPTDFARAIQAARGDRFLLGILYRRDPGVRPAVAGADYSAAVGVWPPGGTAKEPSFPGD